MEIILLLTSKQKRLNLSVGILGFTAICTALAVVSLSIFYSGARYAASRSENLLQAVHAEISRGWEDELISQGEILKDVKLNTEKSLDAIASRISVLQGHVMRLDALGARLAVMADIKDLEFGIDHPPGMGGPVSRLEQQSINVSNLLANINELEVKVEDRKDKLVAMETMLINRTLQEQTVPKGFPVANGWISSPFGYRTDPMTGKNEMHEGLDFAGKPGTPVSSIAAGIVTWSGPRYGYGKMIEISHGNGYITRYAHNQKNLVSVGEKVEKGEVIAVMGSTGRSTGTHVHVEVMYNGVLVDPKKFIVLN